MSNHSGSYMLNSVLELLHAQGVFEWLGKEKTDVFMKSIQKLSWDYDCNPGEILEDGICEKCR